MGHIVERCDFIDVLEESARMHRSVSVTLKGGPHFVDQARDVVTDEGEDWVVFQAHDRIRVADISDCHPTEPPVTSYRGKL